ncbi:MAG: WD40/YVTN/BNR-like repeat-containing protein [Chitinophagaceae bacterium]
MKNYFLLLTGLVLTCTVSAQKVNWEQFKNWKPRNIGPAGMSGRITAIDAVVANPTTVYVGAASGGVWKTENGGQSWNPIFDEQPIQNIGSIAIQQSNPNVVWVGTGEGNPRNSLNLGAGIYKSLDAGKSWKKMGLDKTICIHRVVIDPANPNTVYAAAIGNPYAEHPERGVFKTTDGGETWSKILYVNDTTGCADLVMDPSNPNKLIASMWQFRRKPWELKSGGAGSGLYMTVDGGKSWKKMGKEEGMPEGPLGRIGIAFARSMPSRVYAKVEATKNGLYKSDDGGFNWQLVNSNAADVTDRPFYYQEIYVDPKNENRIYDVHSTITLSEDGGKSFSTLIPYSGIHPDHHAWWIHPENPNLIIEGNDGGIGISRDRGKSWNFDEKIPVGQFYHINVDNEIPYNVMGGMQDNGSWHGPAYVWINGGIRNYYWHNIGGGDGFDVMPDVEDASWVYSESQGGSFGRRNWKTGESWYVKPPAVDPSIKMRFNWNTPMAQDPFDTKTIYLGSQFVHKSTDKGASWQTISTDLTTNDSAKIYAFQNTGGLTLDITGAETHCSLLTIAPSTKQKGVIWAGTDDGQIQLTKDGGQTWTNFAGKISGLPAGSWIPQITASRHNAGEAFVVANDYRRGDFKPYIFRTTDFGKTWTRLIDENKVNGYALCMIQDPVEPNLIFVGTEHGLWISVDNGVNFSQWKNGYPSVSTYDLAIQEREADLAIATFGRALWILDDIRPLRQLAASTTKTPTKNITVFQAPEAIQAQYKPADGYEWSVMGIWDADNRPRGAAVSFYINKPKRADSTNIKTNTTPTDNVTSLASIPGGGQGMGGGRGQGGGRMGGGGRGFGGNRGDSISVRIYNSENGLIRSLRWTADTGFNRVYWGMEEKGYRQPGSPKPQPGSPEPGGFQVLPGTYKVVLTYAGQTDSTSITVKDDPRLGNRNEIKIAQRKAIDRLRKAADKLTLAMDRMNEAEEVCNKIINQVKGLEGKPADSLRKTSNALLEDIKRFREAINGKTSDKQGITRSPFEVTVLSQLQTAQQTINAKMVAPGAQEEQLIVNAENAIKSILTSINEFFAGKWEGYKKQVEETKLNLFKEYKPIE